MKNQPNNPTGGANADKSQNKAPAPNAERQTGNTKPADSRNPGREGVDAPRNEQGNRNEPTNKPGKPMPRVDDHPEPKRKDDRTDSQQAPGAALPNRGTPGYGDTEPNDPRKLDVDAGTGGRAGSGDRSNRS